MKVPFLLTFSIFLLLLPLSALGGEHRVLIQFSEDDLTFKKENGYDLVFMKGLSPLGEVGAPSLPELTTFIALPEKNVKVQNIEIIREVVEELPGIFNLYPVQEPLHTGEQPSSFHRNNANMSLYPPEPVRLNYMSDLFGVDLAGVSIYPLQYDPILGSLLLYRELEIEIRYTDGREVTEPERSVPESRRHLVEKMIQQMVINPQEVSLPIQHTAGGEQQRDSRDPSYEHVIICPSSFETAFQPLAEWHNKKGVHDNIVTTSWIYGNFSGGSNAAKIRNFVIWASSTWGSLWFLLGGDTGEVPYGTSYYVGDTIPHDTYYSDYDDDWVCEVFVGRAPVTSASQVTTFVNKVLTYEKNPPAGFTMRTIGLFGFDLDAQSPGEVYMEYMADEIISPGWSQVKVYDTDSGDHKDMVLAAMNNGLNLIAHIDHCNWDSMGMGYTNHGLTISRSDMDSLTNGNRLGLINSTGCWPNAIDYDSMAERYMQNPNGGGYAFIGNTRYGWYNPGQENHTLSEKLLEEFFHSLFVDGYTNVGQALADSKNNNSPGSYEHMQYCWVENVLLGEPELTVWTSNPTAISTAHLSTIYIGSQDFPVSVFRDGLPLEGCRVGLWKDGDVQEVGITDVNGEVSLPIAPGSTGALYVTVTGANALPYEGTCTVISGSGSPPSIGTVTPDHGPVSGGTNITIAGSNFTDDTMVWFGNCCSQSVTMTGGSELQCTTPQIYVGGSVDVKVLTRNGEYTLPGGFTYDLVAPLVGSITPDHGPAEGGPLIPVTGCYFVSSTISVSFDGLQAVNVTVLDPLTLTCETPSTADAGFVDVTVTNEAGPGTLAGGFRFEFPPPVCLSITPSMGPPEGGTEVTISGNFFYEPAWVFFEQAEAVNLTMIDSHTLVCETPPYDPGTISVWVHTFSGAYGAPEAFTYAAELDPVINNVFPGYGHITGGELVTLNGANFTTSEDVQVFFDGAPGTEVDVRSPTYLVVKSPPGGFDGDVDIQVTTSYGSTTLPNGYTYLDRPVLYFIGGNPLPGRMVGFKVVAPDRVGQGIMFVANNNLQQTWIGPPYSFFIDISLDGYLTLYQTITNNGPKINASGWRDYIIRYPNLGGPIDRFQAIVGTLNPQVDVAASNPLDF